MLIKYKNYRYDKYYHKAKKFKLLARSFFKLKEIDSTFNLIGCNDFILDIGCSPGSWMQYICEKIKKNTGVWIGIDIQPIKVKLIDRHIFVQKNIYDLPYNTILNFLHSVTLNKQSKFTLILSDIAKINTGIKTVDQSQNFYFNSTILNLTNHLLSKNGSLCVKILDSIILKHITNYCKFIFKSCHIYKPSAIRNKSKEVYLLGVNKKN